MTAGLSRPPQTALTRTDALRAQRPCCFKDCNVCSCRVCWSTRVGRGAVAAAGGWVYL